jgi:DNA-binding transcriptional ArsR family regulator
MQSPIAVGQAPAQAEEGEAGRAAETAALFEVLANDGCRAVLRAVGDETLTASEIRDRIDAPMSSIYRHLDALTDVGLLEESVRINPHGRNQNQYSRTVADLVISFDDDIAVRYA